MKILMDVSGVRELDDYIDSDIVPMVVCTPQSGVSSSQQEFLDTYYEKVVDKRGWTSYYCNIINANKCREGNYESVMETNGKEEFIKDFGLKKIDSIGVKYVVAICYNSGKIIDGIQLVKKVRLKVETKKKQVNNMKTR